MNVQDAKERKSKLRNEIHDAHEAREEDDEKHLAPLQLGVLERCIKLWSNPGDVVYDPFMGVGSTPYMALRLNRKARRLNASYDPCSL